MSNRIPGAGEQSSPEPAQRRGRNRSFRDPLVLSSALCGVAIAATACLLEPLESALSNWHEIDLTIGELLLELLPGLGLAVVGLAVTAAGLTRLLGSRVADVLGAGTLALFVQGTLLVFDYGPFDGREIDWRAHWPEALAELAVWGGLVGLAIARPGLLPARAIAIGVLAFGALSVLATAVTTGPRPERVRPESPRSIGPEIVTSFSRESNVIVVVLDTLQSDFFADAMMDPELARAMPPGFVFYRNAVALYPSTELSLQSILTSRSLDLEQSVRPWRAQAMRQSIPELLSRAGYQASLLTFSPHNLACRQVQYGYACLTPQLFLALADSSSSRDDPDRRHEARTMLALAWFRLAPWIVKPAIYDDGHWQLAFVGRPDRVPAERDTQIPGQALTDLAVYDALLRRADAESEQPTFRLIHMFATHFPNFLDPACQLTKAVPGPRVAGQHWWRRRVRAIWTTRCALSRLYAFFRRLDEIGAYDPSLIFVVSDHGHPKIPLSAEGASPPLPDPPDASTTPGIEMPAGGVPLFLVKQPGDREPMRVSDVPVSLCDVPASIVDALGLDGRFDCHSIFAAAGQRPRPREHFRLEGRSKWQPPYRASRWIVDGHSWRPSSWRPAPLP